MKHDAKIQIIDKLNKEGKLYQVLEIYINDGEQDLKVHDIYIKDSLAQILQFVLKNKSIKQE